MGWDLSDPERTKIEYDVLVGRVDYALFRPQVSRPVVLLEAKRQVQIHYDEDQLANYVRTLRLQVGYGVLTDGRSWRIYDLSVKKRGGFAKKLSNRVSILHGPLGECAQVLNSLSYRQKLWPGM